MARWTASAKWAAGPALDGRRATLLGLGLNEGLGISARGMWKRADFACAPFCLPLRATARAVAVLRVCGARQKPCMALRALHCGPPVLLGVPGMRARSATLADCLLKDLLVAAGANFPSCDRSRVVLALAKFIASGAATRACTRHRDVFRGSAACGCSVHADRRTSCWSTARWLV